MARKRYKAPPRLGSKAPAATNGFQPGVYEDLGPRPVYVKSRDHLRELCKERGLNASGLMDHDMKGLGSRGPNTETYRYDKASGKVIRVR